jgi:hypothetical protein
MRAEHVAYVVNGFSCTDVEWVRHSEPQPEGIPAPTLGWKFYVQRDDEPAYLIGAWRLIKSENWVEARVSLEHWLALAKHTLALDGLDTAVMRGMCSIDGARLFPAVNEWLGHAK